MIARCLHQLSVALWFGSVAFFTVAGLLIFQAFEEVALETERPAWLPVVPLYAGTPPEGFPTPLAREQGSRAAGVAVSGVFPFLRAANRLCCGGSCNRLDDRWELAQRAMRAGIAAGPFRVGHRTLGAPPTVSAQRTHGCGPGRPNPGEGDPGPIGASGFWDVARYQPVGELCRPGSDNGARRSAASRTDATEPIPELDVPLRCDGSRQCHWATGRSRTPRHSPREVSSRRP